MSDRAAIVRELRTRVESVSLPLDLGGSGDARLERRELLDQVDDYLLPRLERLDAPLLAVIGGSTGAGKSTITNSLVGHHVSAAGVLRPTTRAPVLVCHPDDEAWFAGDGVLPDLVRSTGSQPATGTALHLTTSTGVPAGLGLLDAPDIDSVEIANHQLAAQLLGAGDLWLFVTTAARYADAVPWAYLARARDRAVALGVVVNRIPPGAEADVATHLREMLGRNGLHDARLFAITERALAEGRLDQQAIGEIDSWLRDLVADSEARDELVRATVNGALASLPTRVHTIALAMEAQAGAGAALEALGRRRYEEALARIDAELDSGVLLRGEVLERWREHVGTGEFMDRLQRGVGRLRDRIRSVVAGSAPPDEAAQGELESNLEILIRQAADQAALETVEGWESLPGGGQLLDGVPRGMDRASKQLSQRVKREIGEWEERVLNLVREQAGNRLAVARSLSLGINGVGVALMVAVFSQTGGLTGGEAGVAAGTAAVSQTVLTAVFGEQAVRTLARRAREDLQLRLAGLFEEERLRFDRLVDTLPSLTAADSLRAAADELDQASS